MVLDGGYFGHNQIVIVKSEYFWFKKRGSKEA